jgi:hypothetical protein
MELGGIVADFLFPYMKIIIQVQGPTHNQFIRMKKDEQQQDLLAEWGYTVYNVDDDIILSEAQFNNWLRNLFNIGGVGGGSGKMFLTTGQPIGNIPEPMTEESAGDDKLRDNILSALLEIQI